MPDGGLYVADVAPLISENPEVQSVVLISHWYAIVPAPVPDKVLVNAAGSPPAQTVWGFPIVPGETVFTVTVIQLLLAVHTWPLRV